MIPVGHAPALAIAIPLIGAFACTLFAKFGGRIRNAWVVIALLAAELVAGSLLLDVLANGARAYTLGAIVPSLTAPAGFPIRIILVADAASALVLFLTMSVSLAVTIYSLGFMKKVSGQDKFYSLVLLIAAGMAGLSLTGDFFTMFVFLEILSISSAGLVAFYRTGESFEAAFKYLVISSIGILFLLFGVGLLYGKYGLLNIAAISRMAGVQGTLIDGIALALIAAALLLKAGIVPAHLWKPDAYQKAPAHIVAMLLASGLVGLFVLARIALLLATALEVNAGLGAVLAGLGVLSIFIGVTMALKQNK